MSSCRGHLGEEMKSRRRGHNFRRRCLDFEGAEKLEQLRESPEQYQAGLYFHGTNSNIASSNPPEKLPENSPGPPTAATKTYAAASHIPMLCRPDKDTTIVHAWILNQSIPISISKYEIK